jgi:hypothetical protein
MSLKSKTVSHFHKANTLDIVIQPTDLLFIDTLHTYDQLRGELLQAEFVSSCIILHDIHTYGKDGEGKGQKGKGLAKAVTEFLLANRQWQCTENRIYNNGLQVLEKTG